MTNGRTQKAWAVPTMPAQIVHGRRAGRLAAGLAVICAGVHVPVVLIHLATYPLIALTMIVLTAICLSCVTRLWRGPLLVDWGTIAGLAATMLALHLFMLSTMNHHHADAALAAATMQHHGMMMAVAPGRGMHMSAVIEQLYHLATALALAQMVLGLGLLTTGWFARARRAAAY